MKFVELNKMKSNQSQKSIVFLNRGKKLQYKKTSYSIYATIAKGLKSFRGRINDNLKV